MSKVVFAGSFDPITFGHMDIIERASRAFDELVVGILINVDKRYMFPMDVRFKALSECCKHLKNVTVKSYDGFLTDFIRQEGTNLYLRGIRDEKDYKYECEIKSYNEELYPEIEYLFMSADPKFAAFSSTMARSAIESKKDLKDIIPQKALEIYFPNGIKG